MSKHELELSPCRWSRHPQPLKEEVLPTAAPAPAAVLGAPAAILGAPVAGLGAPAAH